MRATNAPHREQPTGGTTSTTGPPAAARPGLEELRAAAFGDRCGLDVLAVSADRSRPVGAAAPMRPGGTELWERWSAGVVLGAQGRYAAAGTLLRALFREAPPLLAAQAAVALASHRRQLGGHALARELDGTALRLLTAAEASGRAGTAPAAFVTDGVGPAGARADALLGLAADAVGLGRLGEAHLLHQRVMSTVCAGDRDPAAFTPSWRTLVRAEWIAAEIALSSGDPDQAIHHGVSARDHAEQGGSLRHAIKSELVRSAGLAMRATAQAIPTLRSVVEQATDSGLVSLIWPAALMLAESDPKRAGQWTKIARKSLVSVVVHAEPELIRCARSSPWVPWSLLPSGDAE